MKYSQLRRFLLIDKNLYLNPEGTSSKDLLEDINATLQREGYATITLRQLQNDLNDMKELLGAPIDSGRGQKTIRYENVSFCVFNQTLSGFDIKGGNADYLTGRLNWLRLQVNYMQQSANDTKLLEVMDYEDNAQLASLELMPEILKNIASERVIRIQYDKDFSGETESRVVHPYFLHQYNQRWYLFALFRAKDNPKTGEKPNAKADGIRCYALDRIKDITNPTYISYARMTPEEIRAYKRKYFGNIVGVDGRGEIEDLTLYFDYATEDEEKNKLVKRFFNLLKSNPFYDGFRFPETDFSGMAKGMVKANNELQNHLMLYAHTAYIDNEKIREGIVARARQILAMQHAQPKGK